MAQLVVRNLEEDVKQKLRKRALQHGRSTEEEVREILRAAVSAPSETAAALGSRIAARFKKLGLDSPIRELRGQQPRAAKLP